MRLKVKVPLALFFSGLYLAAQPLPLARKSVYLETKGNSVSNSSSTVAATDYLSFLRTFLIVRLQQSQRLQVEAQNEPPCSPRAAAEAVGAGAQERGPGEVRRQYFRINTNVQQRRDAADRTLDVTVNYEVVSMDNCQARPLLRDSVSFSPRTASGELQSLVETIATRINEEAAEKIAIYLNSPAVTGTSASVYQTYLRGVKSALGDALDYRISLAAKPNDAQYVIDSSIKLTAPKKKNAGTVDWKITVKDNSSGQTYDDFPSQITSYKTDADLSGVYLDAGATIVSTVSELRYRQLAKIEGDPAQVTSAVVLRRARVLLCVESGAEADRECDSRPQVALSLLNGGRVWAKDDYEELYLKGEASFQVRQYEAAARDLDAALSSLPANQLELRITLLHRAGQAWFEIGEFEKASEEYWQSIQEREVHRSDLPARLGPQASEYTALADCYRQLDKADKTQQALDALLSAAALGLDAAEIGSHLDPVLEKLKGSDLEQAIARVARASNIDQSYVSRARERLADDYETKGKYLESAQLHEQVYQTLLAASVLDQHELCLQANKAGVAFERSGEYDKALKYDQIARDHAKSVWRLDEESTSTLVQNISNVYVKAGKPGEAEKVLRDFVNTLRLEPKISNEIMVQNLRSLETSLEQQHKYPEAEKLFDELLDKQKTAHGAQSREYAALLEDKATLYQEMYRFDDSEDLHKKALDTYKVASGPGDNVVAMVLNNLGIVQQFRGDFANALSSYEQAVAIRRKNKPEEARLGLATSLQNDARISARIGDSAKPAPERSEELAKEALKLVQELESSPTSENAVAFNTLGEVLMDLGKYKDASQAFETAVVLYQRREVSIPDRYTEYAALRGQALLDLRKGDFASAESRLAEAVKVIQQRWGPEDWREVLTTADLGRIALERGQREKAVQLGDSAERIRSRSRAADKWLEFAVRSLRVDIALDAGDLAKAEQLSNALDADGRVMLTERSPYALEARVRLARVVALQGDAKRAEQVLDSFDIKNVHIADHHWVLGEWEEVKAQIAGQDPRRAAEAESHFAKAEEIYKDTGGPECPQMARLLRDRAAFLNRVNRSSEGAAALAQAGRIEAKVNGK